MVIRAWAISGLCAIGLVFGCAGADDVAEGEMSEDELSTIEQEVITPILLPGEPAGRCVPACIRFDVSGSVLGQCCICNGVTKVFKRSTISPTVFLCQ